MGDLPPPHCAIHPPGTPFLYVITESLCLVLFSCSMFIHARLLHALEGGCMARHELVAIFTCCALRACIHLTQSRDLAEALGICARVFVLAHMDNYY